MEATRYYVSEQEKVQYITALTEQLPLLRAKAGIAQDELSSLVGISRQTYGAIERKVRQMSWNTYLSLVLFFDYNKETHQAIHDLGIFPHGLVERFNSTTTGLLPTLAESDPDFSGILEQLDRQALHAINTVIMLEYARCTNLPGASVVKSFDGRQFHTRSLTRNAAVRLALQQLKEKKT